MEYRIIITLTLHKIYNLNGTTSSSCEKIHTIAIAPHSQFLILQILYSLILPDTASIYLALKSIQLLNLSTYFYGLSSNIILCTYFERRTNFSLHKERQQEDLYGHGPSECPCGTGNQTMEHLIYECQKLQREREKS
jgi:hypothetical protein